MTKAQAVLDGRIGSWDVWRRSHVFSSADAAPFTCATDAERKRLLENLLSLDKFDTALEACRADRRAAEVAVADVERRAAVLAERLSGAKQRLADAQAVVGEAVPIVPSTVAWADLVSDGERAASQVRARWRELATQPATLEAEVRTARRQQEALANDVCPTCGQGIDESLRARAAGHLTAASRSLEQRRTEIAAQEVALKAEVVELEEELSTLRAKATEAQVRASEARREEARQASRRAVLEESEREMGRIRDEAQREIAKAASLSADLGGLQACEQALGLRGVRAHVLGRALGGIEAAANAWATKLGGMPVKLRPYSERKSGGVADCISIDIEGRGDYRATSGGERRRIDVAMMLALAEIAAAAHGQTPGTLWFDEVFDALDGTGVAAACSVLSALAEERAVIVISHSDALVGQLDPAVHLRVEDGVVSNK
jgi:DNA repair exonuclease SbcCD ATPase subunit